MDGETRDLSFGQACVCGVSGQFVFYGALLSVGGYVAFGVLALLLAALGVMRARASVWALATAGVSALASLILAALVMLVLACSAIATSAWSWLWSMLIALAG